MASEANEQLVQEIVGDVLSDTMNGSSKELLLDDMVDNNIVIDGVKSLSLDSTKENESEGGETRNCDNSGFADISAPDEKDTVQSNPTGETDEDVQQPNYRIEQQQQSEDEDVNKFDANEVPTDADMVSPTSPTNVSNATKIESGSDDEKDDSNAAAAAADEKKPIDENLNNLAAAATVETTAPPPAMEVPHELELEQHQQQEATPPVEGTGDSIADSDIGSSVPPPADSSKDDDGVDNAGKGNQPGGSSSGGGKTEQQPKTKTKLCSIL